MPLHILWIQLEQPPPQKKIICADAIETHATGFFARLLKHMEPWPKYQDLGFAHVDPESLSFHVCLPDDQLLL